MIPKVIHYCWFGKASKSAFIKKCMQTWTEKMPDYQIKEWNETNFNFQEFPFIKSAYEQKKWAFVADYVRLYVLYTEGGIYMDTDVKVMKGFNEFIKYDFFSANEIHPFFFERSEQNKINPLTHQPNNPDEFINGFGILSAVMGSRAGLPYLKDCIDYYKSSDLNATSDRWLVSSSYLVFKNLSLSYELPKKWMKNLGIEGLMLNAGVENLFTLTARKGLNPQYSFNGGSDDTYVTARVYNFGLTVKF